MTKCKHPKTRRTKRSFGVKTTCAKCGYWYIVTPTGRLICKGDD